MLASTPAKTYDLVAGKMVVLAPGVRHTARAERSTRMLLSVHLVPSHRLKGQPQCLVGSRSCLPEDVGGPWGYAEHLQAMAGPGHERH